MIRYPFVILLMLCSMLFSSGCTWVNAGLAEVGINRPKPHKVFTLNRLWDGKDPLTALKLQGTAANGQVSEKTVNKFAMLTSNDVVGGKVVTQSDGSQGLLLALSPIALSRWRMTEQECKYESYLVFVVDGQIFGHVNVPDFDEEAKTILVTGKWANVQELAEIVAAIPQNQQAFNF